MQSQLAKLCRSGRQLFTELYQQLRSSASQQRRRLHADSGHTASSVHDVYFRVSKPDALDVRDRVHFYAVAGKAMDRTWGIGLAQGDERASDPNRWNGLNLLGFALMQVRDRALSSFQSRQ